MDYLELAAQLLRVTHPKGKRPPLHRMENFDRMKDVTLQYLYENGGTASPRELADAFDISSARVTKVLGDLEAEGLALREGDGRDRRRIIVRLTAAGRGWVEHHRAVTQSRVASVLEELGPEDAAALVRLLEKLIHVVEERCCREKEEP